MPATQVYDLNDLALAIEASEAGLDRPFQRLLESFPQRPDSAPLFTVRLEKGRPDQPPPGTSVLFEGEMLPDVPCRLSKRDERTWLVVEDRCSITIDRDLRIARLRTAAASTSAAEGMLAIHAIDAALEAAGQALVHGAALALPDGTDRCLLLFAPSGRGKTTTTLALALGGFGLMTDDAIVLKRSDAGGGGLAAWGLPRDLKVHRNTAGLLPEVGSVMRPDWDVQGEQAVKPSLLAQFLKVLPPHPLAIAAAIVLGPRAEAHRLEPLAKAAAAVHVLTDNLAITPFGVEEGNITRMRTITSMLSAVPTLELNVGPNLRELPGFVSRQMIRYLV